jgi:hypothetical protein
MDPMNTPDHSGASPVISGGCNRLRTYPYFRPRKTLNRKRSYFVCSNSATSTQATPGHHDHPQLGSSTTTEGEVKALPCSAHLARHGGLLVAPRRLHTAPYDGSHTEHHLRNRETLFQQSWRDQPSQWLVRIGQAVFHSTGSAGASRPGWLAHTFLAYPYDESQY